MHMQVVDKKLRELTLLEAYEAWVATSPVTPQWVNYAKYAGARSALIALPRVTASPDHRMIEERLVEMGYTSVAAENAKKCCTYEHFEKRTVNGTLKLVGKPDSDVCDRERAWRKYVKIRDGAKP